MPETAVEKPVEITLGDGSKIVGKDLDDALRNAAKRLEDRAADLKTAQQKAAELEAKVHEYQHTEEERKAEQERLAAVERQKKHEKEGGLNKDLYYKLLNDDPVAAANYLDAVRMGIEDPNTVPQRFNAMAAQISEINQERVASAFWRQHPEFPSDLKAARALDTRVTALIREGHPFNVRTFNMAYEELVGEETIKPLELEEIEKGAKEKVTKEEKEERPNPSLTGSGAGTVEDAELRKLEHMSDKDLEAMGREKGWVR